MVTTRIMARRRLHPSLRQAHPIRRRRSAPAAAVLAQLPGTAALERLRLPSFSRVYVASAALLALAISYLVVSAQATQTSYELTRLKDVNAQLAAEQDQLRYHAASLHTPARVEQEAALAGLQRSTSARFLTYEPVAVDLGASIGPARPDDRPLWQRVLASALEWTRDLAVGDR